MSIHSVSRAILMQESARTQRDIAEGLQQFGYGVTPGAVVCCKMKIVAAGIPSHQLFLNLT